MEYISPLPVETGEGTLPFDKAYVLDSVGNAIEGTLLALLVLQLLRVSIIALGGNVNG